jgi:hypothetical protein
MYSSNIKRVAIFVTFLTLTLLSTSISSKYVISTSIDTKNVDNLIEVPIAWCGLSGSPAVENPNIPNPSGGFDTTTEEVLDRRLERMNNNIFEEQAGIRFVSSNLNNSNSFSYPVIDDQNTTIGNLGDIVYEGRGMQEYADTVNECRNAWMDISEGDSFNGIPVVNLNLFKYENETIKDTGGMSECAFPPANCGLVPHTGNVAIIDNYYSIPGIISLPPTFTSCTNSTWNFWNKDPFDQMLAHELGHALGLGHDGENGSLMLNCQQFNGPGGTISNIYLNQTEIDRIREIALTVTGSRINDGL